MSEESTIIHHHHDHGSSSYQQYETSSSFPTKKPSAIEESRVIHQRHESNQPLSFDFPKKSEESGVIHHHQRRHKPPPPPPPPPPHYGTFLRFPFAPAIGFPQPLLPIRNYNSRFEPVPGKVIVGEPPVIAHHRLPCCGLGYGWFLFIIGFFMAGVPWYAAAIIFLCCENACLDPREKRAYVCCTIFAVLGIITTILGVMSYDAANK
ncbi:hypothetical protein vseg_007601 [Gypsophila vaccaria]